MDRFSSTFMRQQLSNVLDVEHGLPEVLYQDKVLNDHQLDELRREKVIVTRMLDYFFKMSRDQQDRFCQALNKTEQEHVANFIKANGRRSDADAGNWPMYCTSEWDRIQPNLSQLVDITDSYHGLVDEMLSASCIKNKHKESIYCRGQLTMTDMNQQLYRVLKYRSVADYNNFIECLNKTQQQHIVNYIHANGRRPDADAENWPLYCTSEWQRIQQNLSQLIDITDSYHGLVDEMLSENCISNRHKEKIYEHINMTDMNKQLYEILKYRSVADYKNFIECLLRTNQAHVVSLLDPERAGRECPLTDENRRCLMANYNSLINLIDLTDLTANLFAVGCITRCQKETIESEPRVLDSHRRLVDVILRGSQSNFDKFIGCLIETGQQHISSVLLKNAVVAEVVAHANDSTTANERHTVEQFMTMLPKTNSDDRTDAVQEIVELMERLNLQNVELIAMQTQQSIHLFFACKSASGLKHLRDLYLSDKLIDVVQQLFRLLQSNNESLAVYRLKWNESEFERCVQYYDKLAVMPEHRSLALHYKRSFTAASLANCPDLYACCSVMRLQENLKQLTKNTLPTELLEAVLHRAIAIVYTRLLQKRFTRLQRLTEEEMTEPVQEQKYHAKNQKIMSSGHQTDEHVSNVDLGSDTNMDASHSLVEQSHSYTELSDEELGSLSMEQVGFLSLKLITFVCDEWYHIITNNRSLLQRQFYKIQLYCLRKSLTEMMEPDTGLLSFLPSEAARKIIQRKTAEERNEELLAYLTSTRDNKVIKSCIQTLTKTDQQHIVNYIQNREKGEVAGLAILINELYVLYTKPRDIVVYDTTSYIEMRRLSVAALSATDSICPRDIASCSKHRCLYIQDWYNIYRIEATSNKQIRWGLRDDHLTPTGLSVNSQSDCNLIVAFDSKITVFTTYGQLVKVIKLQANIYRLYHAVQLTTSAADDDQYVFCQRFAEDSQVHIVDEEGHIIKSSEKFHGSRFQRLAVIKNGFILAADTGRGRLVLFSRTLRYIGFQRVLSNPSFGEQVQQQPCSLWFDERNDRLHVGLQNFGIPNCGGINIYGF